MKIVCFFLGCLSIGSAVLWQYIYHRRPDNWLVEVGSHVIVQEDYERKVKSLSLSKQKTLNNKKIKEALLDQMIDKQVLLQEAQHLNVDKEKDFLLLVESFWKKAMIERLLLRKAEKISKHFSLNSKELEEYSKQFDFRMHARIRVLEKKETAMKLMKKEFLSYEEQMSVRKDSGWNWFVYEEVNSAYRNILFNMDKNSSKLVYHYNLGWVFLEVDNHEKRTFKSPMEKDLIFMKVIKEDLDVNIIKKWIEKLRKEYPILINKECFNQIESVHSDGKK